MAVPCFKTSTDSAPATQASPPASSRADSSSSLRLKPHSEFHNLPPQHCALLVLLQLLFLSLGCPSAAFLLPWQTFPHSQLPSDAFLFDCTALIGWPLSHCIRIESAALLPGLTSFKAGLSLLHLCPQPVAKQWAHRSRGKRAGWRRETDNEVVWTEHLLS